MKIKKLLKNSLIFFSPFILILFLLFCINILIKDLEYGHKVYNADSKSMDWFSYLYFLNKKKINNYLINLKKNEDSAFPKVEINISEKSLNKLLENIPKSTKKYVSAEFKINGIKQKVKMRYFGDNPINWMFHQKAIRIKTKKSELINGKRYFEYKPSQQDLIDDYISYKFAKKLNLLVSDVRLVELYVNDKSLGIFIERERLNESFLRRNKIMPVNLYKGEASRNSERKIGLLYNLDENPGLWQKISFLNTVDVKDYNDLAIFTNNIRKADSSSQELKNLLQFGNDKLLANIAILEILLNGEINDYTHNRRLAIDVWSGKKHIIPHDFIYNRKKILEESFELDFCSTRLFCVLNQSSEFLDIKYNLLYKAVKDQNIFDDIIEDLEALKSQFLISQKTDLGVVFRKSVLSRQYLRAENEESFNQLIESLKQRKEKILKILERDVSASWEKTKKGFDLVVDKSMPISNLLVNFEKNKPDRIILDYNNNKRVDKEDVYFYPNSDGEFQIKLKFFANRILINQNKLASRNNITTASTKISFLVDNGHIPSELITFNNFTNKYISLKLAENVSNYPSLHNKIILSEINDATILSGNIFLIEDLILDQEVEIRKGTVFTLDTDVSILFKNKVIALGTKKNPIIFKKKSNSNNWGTIAFHGKHTKGSIFKNIIIENGSGKSINGINYFAALSVHSAKNITFDNILVKNNSKFDDMMHIIYSDNIHVLNSKFLNAHLDSIDVDISKKISFENTNIISSGNDGIDFMESTANLDKMLFVSNNDKAISIGENSNVTINNSKFKNNNYGVASKDLSKASIKNSVFEENKIQLSAYKKNWRYGNSGIINIKNSNFIALQNNFVSDKKGEINIFMSNFDGKILKSGNVNIN